MRHAPLNDLGDVGTMMNAVSYVCLSSWLANHVSFMSCGVRILEH